MQLVCSGEKLDLYENTNIQFTDDNPLFAFDKLSCERTTAFKIPATAKNDRVFSLARVPAYKGEGMRRKFDAQLQLGAVVKDGYLYVGSWSGKEYETIFVTGEFVGLQALKDAGKIADYWGSAGTVVWSAANVKDANTAEGQANVAITRYKTNGVLCLPSVDLGDVMNLAYQRLTGSRIASYMRGFRLIKNRVESVPEMQVSFRFLGLNTAWSDTPAIGSRANNAITTLNIISSESKLLMVLDNQENMKFWTIGQFVAGQDILLTFPSNFSSNYFLMSIRDTGASGSDPEYNVFSTEWFLGGYSFSPNLITNTLTITGQPLAGRTVAIESGQPFVLVNKNWITWRPNAMNVSGIIYGFQSWSSINNTYVLNITVEGTGVKIGDRLRIVDILPDLTLVELLKMYCALTGKILNYDAKNGVTFDDLDFASWQEVDVTEKLMSVTTVKRTFGDYVQRNLIQFASGDEVEQSMRITEQYTIDNDNLPEEAVLSEIPYSEGGIAEGDGVVVAWFEAEDGESGLLSPSIGIASGVAGDGTSSRYMKRAKITKNANLQALCDASTQVVVQARMNMYEYSQVTAKTKILMRGTEYVWTSKQWQNDVAKFVLAKISA